MSYEEKTSNSLTNTYYSAAIDDRYYSKFIRNSNLKRHSIISASTNNTNFTDSNRNSILSSFDKSASTSKSTININSLLKKNKSKISSYIRDNTSINNNINNVNCSVADIVDINDKDDFDTHTLLSSIELNEVIFNSNTKNMNNNVNCNIIRNRKSNDNESHREKKRLIELIYNQLQEIIIYNENLPERELESENTSAFYNAVLPEISILDYMMRIILNGVAELSSIVLIGIYLDRFMEANDFKITKYTVYR